MKLIRYQSIAGDVRFAAQTENGAFEIAGDIYGKYTVTERAAQIGKLLTPVVPSNILCIGLNYKRHAEESGAKPPECPVLFVKGNASVQNPEDPIELPRHMRSDEVDYECELAIVIGKPCKNVRREEALDYVLGYTCAND